MRKISIISLFPEVVEAYLRVGMLAKAQVAQLVQYSVLDLRDFGLGTRKQVDDIPYGGGEGMILRIEPLAAAIESVWAQSQTKARVILLSPRGHLFEHQLAESIAADGQDLILVGGRYTGYDERLLHWVDCPISIGRYVLTGAELPALVVVDAVVRLMEGVVGDQSRYLESYRDQNQVGYPQYTRPAVYRQLAVPEVLKTGHHQEIDSWRQKQINDFKLPFGKWPKKWVIIEFMKKKNY